MHAVEGEHAYVPNHPQPTWAQKPDVMQSAVTVLPGGMIGLMYEPVGEGEAEPVQELDEVREGVVEMVGDTLPVSDVEPETDTVVVGELVGELELVRLKEEYTPDTVVDGVRVKETVDEGVREIEAVEVVETVGDGVMVLLGVRDLLEVKDTVYELDIILMRKRRFTEPLLPLYTMMSWPGIQAEIWSRLPDDVMITSAGPVGSKVKAEGPPAGVWEAADSEAPVLPAPVESETG